jgi:hypothetical protein
MTTSSEYEVRPWGDGFWRWECRRCSPRGTRGSYGVLGGPFGQSDVERIARSHVQERHTPVREPQPV